MKLDMLLQCFKGFYPASWTSITLNHHYLTQHLAPPSRYQIHVSKSQTINGKPIAGKYLLVRVHKHRFALKSEAHPQLGLNQYVCHTHIGGKYNLLTPGQPVQGQIRKALFWEIILHNARNKRWLILTSFGIAAISLHAWGELSGNFIAEIIVFICVIILTLVGLWGTR